MIKAVEHLSYEERVRAGIFSMKEGCKKEGIKLFSVVSSDRTRGSGGN